MIMSNILHHGTMASQLVIMKSATMYARNCQALSARRDKLGGETIFTRKRCRLIVCMSLDPSDKDNMLWHHSDHPFSRQNIRLYVTRVWQDLFVC